MGSKSKWQRGFVVLLLLGFSFYWLLSIWKSRGGYLIKIINNYSNYTQKGTKKISDYLFAPHDEKRQPATRDLTPTAAVITRSPFLWLTLRGKNMLADLFVAASFREISVLIVLQCRRVHSVGKFNNSSVKGCVCVSEGLKSSSTRPLCAYRCLFRSVRGLVVQVVVAVAPFGTRHLEVLHSVVQVANMLVEDRWAR